MCKGRRLNHGSFGLEAEKLIRWGMRHHFSFRDRKQLESFVAEAVGGLFNARVSIDTLSVAIEDQLEDPSHLYWSALAQKHDAEYAPEVR